MSMAIIQTTDASSPQAKLGQDMLLALASLDLNPQLVLSGDGLRLWLRSEANSSDVQSLHKRYAMLELFDCPAPWVNADELAAHGWQSGDFIAHVEVLDADRWRDKIHSLSNTLVY
ncbi:DsrE family protein [Pseudidiomarina donghaiensis]|uniref:Uncharacterized protein n=1 Tax=Pseudidiomarina donghaiensis TaxID=519452 RepID=A0A432XMI2_9GAMM|nr:DsrE family protein [Pseudidiomarina donghaiensis]RUO49914.1 hypothetical protein CWE24_05455 [Pseudidiomarina donghaiensis]SFV22130.1 Sulfur relay (sulfurtransferase) complex TusC component, DsrF/TusC family [Pseudidiomarina donghaiensis]